MGNLACCQIVHDGKLALQWVNWTMPVDPSKPHAGMISTAWMVAQSCGYILDWHDKI